MQTRTRKMASNWLWCVMLLMAITVGVTGCNSSSSSDEEAQQSTQTVETVLEGGTIGEGSIQFLFSVVDKDGNETQFEVYTDKETVGEALLELNLIAGDESEYGLFVKTVNGITADYDKDGVYWAFYVNDEYASTGVDATKITQGDSYSFRVE